MEGRSGGFLLNMEKEIEIPRHQTRVHGIYDNQYLIHGSKTFLFVRIF